MKEKEIIKIFEKKLKERYGLTLKQFLNKENTNKEIINIPLGIFKTKLGACEAITRYLHEIKKLKFTEISRLINRDPRTVWINYNNSIKNNLFKFNISLNEIEIPLDVFSNRKLSVFESLIYYLRKKGYKNKEISKLINKDERNIATFYSRAIKKLD